MQRVATLIVSCFGALLTQVHGQTISCTSGEFESYDRCWRSVDTSVYEGVEFSLTFNRFCNNPSVQFYTYYMQASLPINTAMEIIYTTTIDILYYNDTNSDNTTITAIDSNDDDDVNLLNRQIKQVNSSITYNNPLNESTATTCWADACSWQNQFIISDNLITIFNLTTSTDSIFSFGIHNELKIEMVELNGMGSIGSCYWALLCNDSETSSPTAIPTAIPTESPLTKITNSGVSYPQISNTHPDLSERDNPSVDDLTIIIISVISVSLLLCVIGIIMLYLYKEKLDIKINIKKKKLNIKSSSINSASNSMPSSGMGSPVSDEDNNYQSKLPQNVIAITHAQSIGSVVVHDHDLVDNNNNNNKGKEGQLEGEADGNDTIASNRDTNSGEEDAVVVKGQAALGVKGGADLERHRKDTDLEIDEEVEEMFNNEGNDVNEITNDETTTTPTPTNGRASLKHIRQISTASTKSTASGTSFSPRTSKKFKVTTKGSQGRDSGKYSIYDHERVTSLSNLSLISDVPSEQDTNVNNGTAGDVNETNQANEANEATQVNDEIYADAHTNDYNTNESLH